MTVGLRIAIELTIFSSFVIYCTSRLNKPYPWNSNVLDCIEGLSVLVFIPAFLYSLAVGIWLL